MIAFKLDFENSSDEFYNYVRDQKNGAPKEILDLLDGPVLMEIVVGEKRGSEIEKWCKNAPGWYGGPKFAPHPIMIDASF